MNISFLHFDFRSDPDPHFFSQPDLDPHFFPSRIRIRGKKCRILIPKQSYIFLEETVTEFYPLASLSLPLRPTLQTKITASFSYFFHFFIDRPFFPFVCSYILYAVLRNVFSLPLIHEGCGVSSK